MSQSFVGSESKSSLMVLCIENVHAQWNDTPILQGVNLEVDKGEMHVILGPNGSGKSTLGKVILGDQAYQKTDGNIRFNGESFDGLEPHERAQKGFFLSWQSPPSIDGVSAKDLLLTAKKSLDPDFRSSFRLQKSLKERLHGMHLSDEFMGRSYNVGASGGEQRKMEMVSLLTLDPLCAFLDEIDSGIDVDSMHALNEGIQEFIQRDGKSVILISHTQKFLQLVKPTHAHLLVQGKIIRSDDHSLISYIHKNGFQEFLPKKKNLKVLSS